MPENTSNKTVCELGEHLDKITLGSQEIYLVSTAHVSQASSDYVAEVIEEIQPKTVAIELCQPRYDTLKDPDRWKNTDIFSVIKQNKTYLLLAQLILSAYQKKIGDQMGVKPGQEMLTAIEKAEEVQAEVSLIDRPIAFTLKRAWGNLGWKRSVQLFSSLLFSGFEEEEEITEEELEELKSRDMLATVFEELNLQLPEIATSLIKERDQYMATKLLDCKESPIVAVIGAGHAQGMKEHLGERFDLQELEAVPKPTILRRVLPWLLPLVVVALFAYGFSQGDLAKMQDMALSWLVINGIAGGLGSLIAGAHPLTILIAILASPFTSLNPAIAGGWVAGLAEAWIRKPKVADFETLNDDITALSGWWTNRVTRILLIVVFTNLLGSLGTFLAAGKIWQLLN